ncbi:urate oxidase [Amycolatopsis mediterranei S699]|uniref:Uricase n=2 Tax=Amycolatopsis mediterranei TaxID=33910 RepID=A0A0H3D076_AMYMU|nr:urate oxidase [Amycolatopsis mediterranei]ADJ43735.1 urate oxidase [Amycolatopsis mediterranei U32]AEK40444.1 urate oxidase [Amycolatopsis mediterranei S699]AFO75446.1 urate oxidase [Amycolatopsis mediterranei S699]AGT82576.1 urate oxidase [Amycolatopsis mediterranei RB]KDO08385.1 urate oxidase [Amycolatopsis mediterranei]
MAITLGPNQYGKAEVRLVTVRRDGPVHHLKDLTVSTSLRGELAATHLTGDNAGVLATDTQKNTVYAFAKEAPVGEIEDFGLRLARHFVGTQENITGARIKIDEHGWDRIAVGAEPHDHAFSRSGDERRTTAVTVQDGRAWIVSGIDGLTLLKSTGSEFHGFPRDEYTTLAETGDRILATAVTAKWRYQGEDIDWASSHREIRRVMLETFATKHSLSLQQTLYAMGSAVLEARPEVAEVRLSLPNKHHFLVDLSPFGLKNDNEVFYAADRPYGLIEGTILRDDAEDAGPAWDLH